MLALVKTAPGPGLSCESVPDPTIGINDVLIRVRKTGICGTDLHIEALGRLGGEDDPAAARRRPRVRRRDRRGGHATSTTSDPGDIVSGEGHVDLRPLPPLPGRPPPPVREHDRAWASAATARSPSTSSCR